MLTFYQFPGGGWVIGDPATGGVETRDLDAVFDALGIRRTQGTTYSVELKNTYSNCAHAELVSSPHLSFKLSPRRLM